MRTQKIRVSLRNVEETDNDESLSHLKEFFKFKQSATVNVYPENSRTFPESLDEDRMREYGSDEVAKIDDNPYQLGIVKPRAIDLRKLWKLSGKSVPPEIEASLGARVPVLLYHGMTPFAKPGNIPKGVWGMGYQVFMINPNNADTVSFAPSSELLKVIDIKQSMKIGLSVGGKMQVPDAASKATSIISGVNMEKVEISGSTDQSLNLALQVNYSVVKVLAGPIGAGGVRWDIFRQDDPLEEFHPLLQTVMLPMKTEKIKLQIKTWIKRAGLFGTRIGSKQWITDPLDFEVSLEGLDS